MILRASRVLTPGGDLCPGWVRVRGEAIAEVGFGGALPGGEPGDVVDLGDVTLAPGFVDQHCHGGGGEAFTGGADAARVSRETHLRHGVTSVVASLVTDTLDALSAQIDALAPLVDADELAGIHLEGPWLSGAHCGAHSPKLLRDPDAAEVAGVIERAGARAHDGGPRVVMATVASERPGGIEAVRAMTAAGVVAALGHSDATYADAVDAIAAGACAATHLFNAERPFHHREPGLIAALLEAPSVTIELIADGVHVHPAALAAAFRAALGRIALVSDAMAAAGAGDGDYQLGPLAVTVDDGVARLADGTIAGSTLTLDAAVRFVVEQCGVALGDALVAASATPARLLGRDDIGVIETGRLADLVVLDADLHVGRVMRRGAWVT